MVDILNRCNYLATHLQDCADIQNRINCPTCVSNSFYAQNNDTYDCLKKLCYYTMNYGPIYVSEIYHFLTQSQILQNNFMNLNRPINIMSLGCGFGPDDIALNKYKISNGLFNLNFNYYGYDIEPLWNYITQTNALPITHNILNGMNLQFMDIVFLNKIVSTLKNHSLLDNFFQILAIALQAFPVGSIIVFNDINHKDMGRDEFDHFASQNSLQVVGKYFFNVDGAYNASYTAIESIHNICMIPDLVHVPKKQVNKTIFFVYRKV